MILHERWFVAHPNFPVDTSNITSASHTWIPVGVALALTAAAFALWRAVVGHLPIYGIMALLLVCGDPYSRKEVAS